MNTAKFKVIHELEEHLPAALFAYEWHHCDAGKGMAYRPITHTERWIPGIFALVYIALAVLIVAGIAPKQEMPKSQVVSGTLDVNVKTPVILLQAAPSPEDKGQAGKAATSDPARRKAPDALPRK